MTAGTETLITSAYEGWAIVELMGHRQRVGNVREVESYGTKMLRVDVPFAAADGSEMGTFTEFYGGSSIYSVRPISEDVAMENARRAGDPRPVQPVGFRTEDRSGNGMTDEERSRAAAVGAPPNDDDVDDLGDDGGVSW